jgi:hypothetical protein
MLQVKAAGLSQSEEWWLLTRVVSAFVCKKGGALWLPAGGTCGTGDIAAGAYAVCGGQRLHLVGWWMHRVHRAIIGTAMATRLLHEVSLQMCGQCWDGAGLVQRMLLRPASLNACCSVRGLRSLEVACMAGAVVTSRVQRCDVKDNEGRLCPCSFDGVVVAAHRTSIASSQ